MDEINIVETCLTTLLDATTAFTYCHTGSEHIQRTPFHYFCKVLATKCPLFGLYSNQSII